MGRPRKYSDDQRAEAVEIYRTEGQAEASRRTDIPGPVINRWAKELGIVSVHRDLMREATETVMEMRKLKREIMIDNDHDIALILQSRIRAGALVEDGKVLDPGIGPPSDEALDLGKAYDIFRRNIRLDSGEVTGRTESTTTTKVTDAIRNDAEWDALERAIQRELALQAAEGQGNAPADGGAVVAAPDTRDGEVREEV